MITCVFGLPGSGKSTLMAKMARDAMKPHNKRYDRVYCNFFLLGAYPIQFRDLGIYNFENSLILIDEAMNEADSRGFKSFTSELKYFFSNHRHYGCDVVYFTQAYDDVDKKIRNNTAELLYIRKFLFWSFTTPIVRKIIINDYTNEIQTGYKMKGFLSSRWYFRPRYYKYFDSFERKNLVPLQARHNQKYALEPVFTPCANRGVLYTIKRVVRRWFRWRKIAKIRRKSLKKI